MPIPSRKPSAKTRPPLRQPGTTYGFTAPFGKADAPLVHVSQDFFLISARKEERILPAASCVTH